MWPWSGSLKRAIVVNLKTTWKVGIEAGFVTKNLQGKQKRCEVWGWSVRLCRSPPRPSTLKIVSFSASGIHVFTDGWRWLSINWEEKEYIDSVYKLTKTDWQEKKSVNKKMKKSPKTNVCKEKKNGAKDMYTYKVSFRTDRTVKKKKMKKKKTKR